MGQYPENSPRSPKCSCLTWSAPSQQTRRYLSRQQSKNQTTERFQCDFCKFSLQHSLPLVPGGSPSKERGLLLQAPCRGASPSPVTATSPRLLASVQTGMGEWWPSARSRVHRDGDGSGKGSAELCESDRPTARSPREPTDARTPLQRGSRSNSSARARPEIISFPAPALTVLQLSFPCVFARRLL